MSNASSDSGRDGDRDTMKNLAARLMGRPPTTASAAPRAAASSFTPRSMPAMPVTSRVSGTAQSPSRSTPSPNENLRPSTYMADTASRTDRSTPVAFITMKDVTAGPSLRGNPEQLAEASAFLSSATRSGNKSRPGSASNRERMISSPKPAKIARVDSPVRTSRPPHQSMTSAGSSVAGVFTPVGSGSGVSALHSRPQVKQETFPTPAKEPESNFNLFLSDTPQGKAENKQVIRPSELPPVERATPSNKPESLQQIDRMKKEEAGRSQPSPPPPHLRKRIAAAEIPQRTPEVMPPHLRDEKVRVPDNSPSKQSPAVLPLPAAPFETDQIHHTRKPSTAIDHVKQPKTETKTVITAIAKDADTVKPLSAPKEPQAAPKEEVRINGKIASPSKAPAIVNSDSQSGGVLHILKSVKQQIEMLLERVDYLEQENFNIQGRLQEVVQAEERRKFLGTGGSKTPFGFVVKCPGGTACSVQVHSELKVYELVRRVCAKTKTSLTVKSVPRVTINGTEVGHGMTLGEVGIKQGAGVEAELSFVE